MRYDRVKLLLKDDFKKLQDAKIILLGVGGVGGVTGLEGGGAGPEGGS